MGGAVCFEASKLSVKYAGLTPAIPTITPPEIAHWWRLCLVPTIEIESYEQLGDFSSVFVCCGLDRQDAINRLQHLIFQGARK